MRRQLGNRRRPVSSKPRRLLLTRHHPPSQHNLKRALPELQWRLRLLTRRQVLVDEPVTRIQLPIKPLLRRDHLRPQGCVPTLRLTEPGHRRHSSPGDRSGRGRGEFSGEPVEQHGRGDVQVGGKRECPQLRAIVLVPRLPLLVADSAANATNTLVTQHLFHPEAGN